MACRSASSGKLVEAGIATIEKLGSMTPEDLEAVQGMAPETVEQIQQVIATYYGAYEQAAAEAEQAEAAWVADESTAEQAFESQAGEPVTGDAEVPDSPEAPEETLEQISEAELLPEGQADDPAISGLSHASSSLKDAPVANATVGEGEFDTIEDTDRPA